MEYNNDFERRRAYISSREKLRKRRRTVHITILLIVLGVLLLGIGGLLLFKKGGRLSTQLKNNTSESSAESDPSGDDKTTVSLAESGSGEDASPESQEAAVPAAAYNTGDTALDGILNSAHAKFVTYDYDAAIEILNSNPDYAENSDVKELLASCEETKSTLVRADVNKITHVFFHSLIMDNSKAFDGDADSKGYNQVMTTKSEFLKILDSMYEKGYVLVKLHDIAHEVTDENGNTKMVAGDIMLPPGKIPFVMSQDDVCYYPYMDGDGFANKIVIGEDGKPTCQMTMDDGTVQTGSFDLVPLLEDFVQEHPDFSYKGARAIIAFTGYEGILGYRTASSYADSPTYEADREQAAKVAQCLRDNGWELASHSWGHLQLGVAKNPEDGFAISEERFKTDTDKWEAEVESLIGPTDILLYPYGNDIADWRPYKDDNPRFKYLESKGFRYFCNVDASTPYWMQMGTSYFRMARRNLDGYRLYEDLVQTDPAKKRLTDLFDAAEIFDPARPTPVSWSYQ